MKTKRLSKRQMSKMIRSGKVREDDPRILRELSIRSGVKHEDAIVQDSFHYSPNARTKTRSVKGHKVDIMVPDLDKERDVRVVKLTKKEERTLKKKGKLSNRASEGSMALAKQTLFKPQMKRRKGRSITVAEILGYHGADEYLSSNSHPNEGLSSDSPMLTNEEKQIGPRRRAVKQTNKKGNR